MEDITLLKYNGKIYNLDSFSQIQNILKSLIENQKKKDILIYGENSNNINEINTLEKNGFLNEFLKLRKKVEELEKLTKKNKTYKNSSCSSSFNSSNTITESNKSYSSSNSNSSISSSNNSNYYSYCSNYNNNLDNNDEYISNDTDSSNNSISFDKNCVLFLENDILNMSEIQGDENNINDNDNEIDEYYENFFNVFNDKCADINNFSYFEEQEIKYGKKFKNLKYIQKQFNEKFTQTKHKIKHFEQKVKECQKLIRKSTNFNRNKFVTVKDFNDINRIRNKFYRAYSKEIKNFGVEKIKNKEEYRDLIFEIADNMYHDEAEKITDMIIKNDETVLNDMVYNVPEFLKETIIKAHNLLQDRNKKYKYFN